MGVFITGLKSACLIVFFDSDGQIEKPTDAYCDSNIGEIENAGAQRSKAQIQKIDNAPFIKNPVHQIPKTAAQQQGHGDRLIVRQLVCYQYKNQCAQKEDGDEYRKNPIA